MEEELNKWLNDPPKDKFDKELPKYTYYHLMEFAEHYLTLQLLQTDVSGRSEQLKTLLIKLLENNMCSHAGDELIIEALKGF
jgi:hypothetical protein